MNQIQMLIKIESQAEEVGAIDSIIPQESITDMPIEDFYAANGDNISLNDGKTESQTKIIKCVSEDAYYKKQNNEWLRCRFPKMPQPNNLPQMPSPQKQVGGEVTKRIIELEEKIKLAEIKIASLDKSLAKGLRYLKEYIDLKKGGEQ